MRDRFLLTNGGRAALGGVLLILVALGAWTLGGAFAAHPTGGAHPAAPVFAPAATVTTTLTGATALPGTPAPAASPSATASPTPPDPYQALDVFTLFPNSRVVKKMYVSLDKGTVKDALLTLTNTSVDTNSVGVVETNTVSLLAVARYDAAGNAWQVQWQSQPVSGTAAELPDSTGQPPRPYQTGDLLRTGQPILLLRTSDVSTVPGQPLRQHLHLWAWTGQGAVPLKMVAAGSSADQDTDFTGTSDVQTTDLDDDGVIEVITDSGATFTVYRWDRTHFVVRP